MAKKLGMYSSLVTFFSVLVYSVFILMIILNNYEITGNKGIYYSNILIGLGFICMIYSYFSLLKIDDKQLGIMSLILSIVYCIFLLLIHNFNYFNIISHNIHFEIYVKSKMFGLFFISSSIFFTGITLERIKWNNNLLKILMYTHIIFGVGVFIVLFELLLNINLIHNNIWLLIVKIWCIYFSLICILSYNYFKNIYESKRNST
jgi:hypothetical protein